MSAYFRAPLLNRTRALLACLAIGYGMAASTPARAREDHGPIPFTPRQLGASATHLVDTDQLLILGGASLTALVVSNWDQEILDWFVEHEPLGPNATDNGRIIGNRETIAIGSASMTGLGLIFKDPYLRNTGMLWLEANLVSAGVTAALKNIVGRERPDGSNDRSFPSGHATSAMTSATVLAKRYGWKVGIITYPLAVYTGLSRIQGNKHYLSDVIVGWAIGYWIATAAVRGTEAPAEENVEDVSWRVLPVPDERDHGLPVLRVRF